MLALCHDAGGEAERQWTCGPSSHGNDVEVFGYLASERAVVESLVIISFDSAHDAERGEEKFGCRVLVAALAKQALREPLQKKERPQLDRNGDEEVTAQMRSYFGEIGRYEFGRNVFEGFHANRRIEYLSVDPHFVRGGGKAERNAIASACLSESEPAFPVGVKAFVRRDLGQVVQRSPIEAAEFENPLAARPRFTDSVSEPEEARQMKASAKTTGEKALVVTASFGVHGGNPTADARAMNNGVHIPC